MKNISQKSFSQFGEIISGDFTDLLLLLEGIRLPKSGFVYNDNDEKLESNPLVKELQKQFFLDAPIQAGYYVGYNQSLARSDNKKGKEILLGTDDFIIQIGIYLENSIGTRVETFFVPKGIAILLNGDTLHYVPVGIKGTSFRVLSITNK